MVDLNRREFLRLIGLATGCSAVGGCPSPPPRRLIPYLFSSEDITPGQDTWYATTCRECPAGCGLLAKNRDGRIIKVEGNPIHPISLGKLCPRGQASLQRLYNPDRFTAPLLRGEGGNFAPISWDRGERLLVQRLKEIMQKGEGERVIFLSGLLTGTERELLSHWLNELGGAGEVLIYELYAYEPLRKAFQVVFGYDGIPHFRIDKADFLISFGAGFLETWLSNVEYARQFGSFHQVRAPHPPDSEGRSPFVYVGPRLSITANNADLWIPVHPGDEYLVALGMLRVILDDGLAPKMGSAQGSLLSSMVEQWSLGSVSARTGVDADVIRRVARRFAAAKAPLALAEGLAISTPNATETAVAANLLCTVNPGTLQTMDFTSKSAYNIVATADTIKDATERMARGEVDLLFVYGANPAFTLPLSWDFPRSLEAVPMVVSFSSMIDETTRQAHLVLPTHTPLESWGDYAPREGVIDLLQPAMGSLFQTKILGDILLSTGRAALGPERFPWGDFYEVILTAWHRRWKEHGTDAPFETFWQNALMAGGVWDTDREGTFQPPALQARFDFPTPDTAKEPKAELHFTAYPTVQFYDGRDAGKPWIQELPDPITQITWGGWLEIHPDTAKKLNISRGDMVRLATEHGSVEAPAVPIFSVPPDILAMPVGQGHTDYGRYASGLPANPMHIFPPDIDPVSRGISRPPLELTLEKLDRVLPLASTDGSYFLEGRDEIIKVTTLQEYRDALAVGSKPEIDIPLYEGYDSEEDIYPPHIHSTYRWCMVVDMDRCIGCGACVVACYAENNVPFVGRDQVLKGREMSWIRVQRYFHEDGSKAWWLIMLCQHCCAAPCESVCPVFAPEHNPEGLNNQVYNRCFGTRFCSQNDPYKVRRFNFFTYTDYPSPLKMQFNPDVTVRMKGVMEKCSFCVQRIVEAKIKAGEEGRLVEDGDFTTACAQTCPTDALTFGNLKDPNSAVSKLIRSPRAYQVLHHLNTKPAGIYLKRVTMEV